MIYTNSKMTNNLLLCLELSYTNTCYVHMHRTSLSTEVNMLLKILSRQGKRNLSHLSGAKQCMLLLHFSTRSILQNVTAHIYSTINTDETIC